MHHKSGFTLIEIVMVLVLLGILTAVAVPKYFDLQDEAEKLAAQTTVAEAQARIHARFAQLLLTNNTCQEALNQVKDLALLADSSEGGARFGDFVLTPTILTNDEGGTVMSAQRVGGTTRQTSVGKLQLPTCSDAGVGSGGGNIAVSESVRDLHNWMVFMLSDIFERFKDRPENEQSLWYKVMTAMPIGSQITHATHPDFFNNWPLAEQGAGGAAITKNSDGSYDILLVSAQDGMSGIVSKLDSTGHAIADSTKEVMVRYEAGRYTY